MQVRVPKPIGLFAIRPCREVAATAFFAVILLGSHSLLSAQDWRTENQKRAEFLERKNGSGTNLDLKKRLLQMKEEEEGLRRDLIDNSGYALEKQERLEAGERKLTSELKDIVREHGWPTIQLVGMEASETASLILSRSSDLEFQREWVSRLGQMVERDEIAGSAIAPVIDSILHSEGKPQLFGSLFRFEGDFMIMEPVQDPQNLDRRRARYLLPPMKETVRIMEDLYHRKLKILYEEKG